LLYTAAQQYANGTVVARLAMAKSRTPSISSSWQRLGVLFPQIRWSKSGALLIRDGASDGLHYLFFGDSSLLPGMQVATSKDLRNWKIRPGVWLPERPNAFDRDLIEAGPMPLQLSDGNYLLIYNSARHGFPSPRPGYDFQYNVGWAILDKNDPSKILQRCQEPLLTPTLPWERGVAPWLGLVPNVVFLEGWIRAPGTTLRDNSFFAVYGAADSVLGGAIINVTITP